MTLPQKVHHFILEQKLILKGSTIIAGVSGGPDSIALLHLLKLLQHELGFKILVAHINHQIHRESTEHEIFVRQIAEQLNLPIFVKNWPAKNHPKKGSLENHARIFRFKFFKQLITKTNADAVALAHTENDQAETILMKMIRGTGMEGLRGILAKREVEEIQIIRPLLTCRKKDILAYCRQNGIRFCIDPTNSDITYTRNKIRRQLMPTLEKNYNPQISNTLSNLADNMNRDYDFIDQYSNTILRKLMITNSGNSITINKIALKKIHPAIVMHVIRKLIRHSKGNSNQIDQKHIQLIIDAIKNDKTCKFPLPGKVNISLTSSTITVSSL